MTWYGMPDPHEVLLDHAALGVGPVEDGQVAPAVVLLVVQVLEPVGHPLGLVGLVVGVVAERSSRPPPCSDQRSLGLRPKLLAMTALAASRMRLGGAVVLVEHDDGGVGERLLELEDVADVGAAELVDRLVGVAHDADVAVLLAQQHDQLVLGPVGVLVLVDQHVLEAAAGSRRARRGCCWNSSHGLDQQVVEVHGAGPLQAGLVLAVDVGDLALRRRGDQAGVLVGADEVVLGRADGGVHRPGREALRVDVEVPQDVAGEADGVGLVVDGEARRVVEAVRTRGGGCARRPSGTWTPTSSRPPGPTRAPTRVFISAAALLVKVMARSPKGETPRSSMR